MEEVKVTIGMDAGPAERELAGLQGNVHRTEQVVRGLTGTVQVSGEDIEKVIAAIASSTKNGSDQVTKKLDEVVRELGKVREASNQTREAEKEHTVSINDMAGAVSALPGPVGQAASAFSNLTSVVRKFIGSPLLWFLAAAAAAYQYLTWSLNRTVEGQEKLDLATAKYQQRLENVKDAASSFGRAIYSALDSAANVADKLLGKFGGIGRILGSLGGGALGPLGSVAGGMVGDWAWNRNVGEAVALQQRENELWQKRKAFKTEEAQLEQRIAEARARAYDDTLSAAEQEAAVKVAVAATNELYDKRKQIAEETRDIAVGRLGLSDSDREAEMAVEQAKADVVNLETQRQNALRFLNRMTTRMNNQDASDAKAAAKAAKDAMEQRDALFRQQMTQEEAHTKQHRAAINAQAEARIAAIEDASERERAEAKHQHELRLQQIQAQADEYRKANYEAARKAYEAAHGAHTYSQTDAGALGWAGTALTSGQKAELEARLAAIEAEYSRWFSQMVKKEEQENAAAIRAYLAQYGDYAQKRQAIYDEANGKICALEEQLSAATTDERREAIEKEIEMVKRGAEKQVEALNVQYGKAKAFFQDLFEGNAEKSIAAINKVRKKYEALVKYLQEYLRTGSAGSREVLQGLGFTDKEIDSAIDIARKEGIKGIEKFTDGLKDLSKKAEEGIQKLSDEFGSFLNTAADAFGALESVAEDDGGSHTVSGISGSINALKSALSGDIGGFITSLHKAVKAFEWEADNHEESIKAEELLRASINAGTHAIDKNTEALKKANGMEAVEASENLVAELRREMQQLYLGIKTVMEDNGYDRENNGVRSLNDVLSGRVGRELAMLIANATGLNVWEPGRVYPTREDEPGGNGRAGTVRHDYSNIPTYEGDGDFSWAALWNNNSPREIAKAFRELRDTNAKEWQEMVLYSTKYTNGELEEWLNNLIDTYDKIEEAEKELFKNLTTISADDAFANFLSSLYDLANGSEDVFSDISKKWQEMVNQMVINNLIGSEMRAEIEAWYEELARLNEQRVRGELTDDQYRERLSQIKQEYDNIVKDGERKVEGLAEAGIIKPLEEVKEYFADIRDSWHSTLTSMSQSTEDWKNELLEQILGDLVDSTILDAPFDVLLGETQWHFKNFGEYLENWNARYQSIIEDQNLTDEERTNLLRILVAEQTRIREEQAERSKELAEGIGMDVSEAISNSLDNLGDTLLDSLLDTEKDAADLGKDIAKTLIREMLQTMLASEKYAGQMKLIKEKWQQVLSGENVNEAGEVLFTMEDVLRDIASLNNTIASDEAISGLAAKYKELEQTNQELSSSFDSLRDSILDSLMDVENGTESFVENMRRTLTRDLIDKLVMDRPVTFTAPPTEGNPYGNLQTWGSYTEWEKSWLEAYVEAVREGDEQLMRDLEAEAEAMQSQLAEDARAYTEGLRKIAQDTTFKDMKGSFVAALMDMDTDAEAWGREIGRTMTERLVKQFLAAEHIQPMLDELQRAMDAAMGADGATAASVLADRGVQTALATIRSRYPELQEVVRGIMEALGTGAEEGLEEVADRFSDLESMVIDGITGGEDAEAFGRRAAQRLMTAMLEEMLSARYAGTLERIRTMLDSALSGNAAPDGTVYSLEAVTEAVKGLYEAFASDSEAAGLAEAIRGIGDAAGETSDVLSGLADTILDALLDSESTAEAFGQQMAQKLIRGLMQEMMSQKYALWMDSIRDLWQKVLAGGETDSEGNPLYTIQDVLKQLDALLRSAATDTDLSALTDWYGSITESLQKAADSADTPLSDLRSKFLATLSDMESSAEEFADDITRTLTEAMIDKFVLGDAFDRQLDEWTQRYEAIMQGDYSEDERTAQLRTLRTAIADAEKSYAEEARRIGEFMGYTRSSDQSATMNLSDKATYEQMDQYLGTQMGIYMATEEEVALQRQILATLQSMGGITKPDSGDVAEIRGLVSVGNDYLRAIRDELQAHLGQIKNNTANLNKL